MQNTSGKREGTEKNISLLYTIIEE